MSTPAFIKRLLTQTVVYWANPVNDGANGFTYDAPVELAARCEHKVELVVTEMGEEILSKAHIYMDQEVDEGEYIYLGTLDALESSPVPSDTEKAMRVLAFEKIPQLGKSDSFIYKAYLNRRTER